jgi:site-specific recombinase XerD
MIESRVHDKALEGLAMSRSRGLWLATSESSQTGEAEVAFEAMLDGWSDQQRSRLLNENTIANRERVVRRFHLYSGVWPWQWLPGHLEAWVSELRVQDHRAHSTIRGYEGAVGAFCDFVCDPAYGWGPSCLTRFGSVPSQICRAENTGKHTSEYEGRPARRPLTRIELQALFDAADDDVESIRSGSKKGWAPAFRDATMLKVTYAWGLRRQEVRMLEAADFSPNPMAAEFGDYGVCGVRFGKAAKGGPPRRRGVLTVFGWSTEVLSEWIEDVWPTMPTAGVGLWPSERGPLVSGDRIGAAFNRCARAAGLPKELTLHCLRHSYVTHLIEDGFDALFVQQQAGHEYASTLAIYTSVSSDYKTKTLRAALDRSIEAAARRRAQ